jgi:hypothetical protein
VSLFLGYFAVWMWSKTWTRNVAIILRNWIGYNW